MDDFIIVIYLLFVLLVLVCTFVLPITALVISIRASRMAKRLTNVEGVTENSLAGRLQNLEARLQRIEAGLSAQPPPTKEIVQATPPVEPRPVTTIPETPKSESPKVTS